MWKKKATTNSAATVLQTGENSEGLIRAVEPLPTYRILAAGEMAVNELHSWAIEEDSAIYALRLLFSAAPTGTLTFQIFNPYLVKESEFTLDLTGAGIATDDAWFFSPQALFIPAGYTLKIKSSQAATQLRAYLAPILLDPPIFSVK